MNPKLLFPLLAVVFIALALVTGVRRRRWQGSPRIWLWLGLCFAAVAAWLHLASPGT